MKFQLYTDVHDFYRATFDTLMRHETQNLVPLGNLIIGHEGKDKTDWRDPAKWVMATVAEQDGIVLTALMTPPHNITLYATDNKINPAVIDCLIAGLGDRPLPGVISEKELATQFAETYTRTKGLSYETTMAQRIYELTQINPDIPRLGTVRLLEERDMYYFPFWLEAFTSAEDGIAQTTMNIPYDTEKYLYHVSQKKIYILEVAGAPVSMAGFTRELQSVVGVAFVFTPPYLRGRGYASSVVAQVSQIALERGFTKCALYTDLANSTSNSIYQKIGYHPVCDSVMLKFV
jgi:RimJ/RimL family protein N-acetyltransferase